MLHKQVHESSSSLHVHGKHTHTLTRALFALGEVLMMYYLQAKGADINGGDAEGHTPLMWAADQARLDAVIFLIKQSVDVQQQDSAGVRSKNLCLLLIFLPCALEDSITLGRLSRRLGHMYATT